MNGKLYRNVVLGFCAMLMLAVFVMVAGGCQFGLQPDGGPSTQPTTMPTLEDLESVRDGLQSQLDAATSAIATLPAGDPVRTKYEDALPKIQRALDLSEQLIKSAQQGAPTAELLGALTGIPKVGPYMPLILLIGGWAVAGISQAQRKRIYAAFVQAVQSIEAALPSKTPEQKQAMAAIQDESTKALVDKVKQA